MHKYMLTVEKDKDGMRLDTFVAECVEGLSRARVKKLIDEGSVRLNGQVAKPSREVGEGDCIVVSVPPPVQPSAVAQHIPLEILYEDADIVVVNKAAGLVVHPAAGHPDGTLVNALLAHCKDLSGIGGELRAGIVHRLDVGTSGVIVAAKNDLAHNALAGQFKDRTIGKTYGALVMGSMRTDAGRFDEPLGRSKGDRKRISAHTSRARSALTEWKVLERFGTALTWVEIALHTGRTHQIRVHFAEAGHPLAGDPLYGGEKKTKRLPAGEVRDAVAKLDRPALHSWRLTIDHPRTGERMTFEAGLPKDLMELLNVLRRAYA
jgi:23S rRNA pseudouridine1911/1915/1917 synthase